MARGRRTRRKKKKGTYEAYIHACRRFKERYNLNLPLVDYNNLMKQIQYSSGESLLYRESNTRTVWELDYRSMKVYPVYQNGIGILTFLTPEMAGIYEEQEAA